jgi:hypothetical protein
MTATQTRARRAHGKIVRAVDRRGLHFAPMTVARHAADPDDGRALLLCPFELLALAMTLDPRPLANCRPRPRQAGHAGRGDRGGRSVRGVVPAGPRPHGEARRLRTDRGRRVCPRHHRGGPGRNGPAGNGRLPDRTRRRCVPAGGVAASADIRPTSGGNAMAAKTAAEIAEILKKHAAWRNGEAGGTRADLSGRTCRGGYGPVQGADLSRANLYGADLSGRPGGPVRGEPVRGEPVRGEPVRGEPVRGGPVRGEPVRGEPVRGEPVRANLSGANLSGANLSGADLSGADLSRANLSGVKNLPPLAVAQTLIAGDGDLVGWKKCLGGVVVKLLIPAAAKRSNATGRKCRAEYAHVLAVEGASVGLSLYDGSTVYAVGETVRPNGWCLDRWRECAPGIHFYLTREEAEAHA